MTNPIRIASYNIENGSHPEEVISNLKKISSENVIFCLQEVRNIKGKKSILDSLNKNFRGNEWGHEYFLSSKNPQTDLGLAIFWKLKNIHLKSLKKVLLPKLVKLNLLEKIWTTGGDSIQRGAIIANFKFGKKFLRIVNLHLDWQGGLEQKANQLTYLLSALKKMSTANSEIILGDFNTTGLLKSALSQEAKIQNTLKDYKNATPTGYTSESRSPDYSHPFYPILQVITTLGINIRQRLDYSFVKGVEVVGTRVENVKGSDHFPLVVDLRM